MFRVLSIRPRYTNLEYSVLFIDVLRDSTILSYLPVNANLYSVLNDYLGKMGDDAIVTTQELFRLGDLATRSIDVATDALLKRFKIPAADTQFSDKIKNHLALWSERIAISRKSEV